MSNWMVKRTTPTVIEFSVLDGICTRKCGFCPVGILKGKHKADLDLVTKVCRDLSMWEEIQQKHVKLDLTPFGEFYLHSKWEDILRTVNKYLSKLSIYKHTNADTIKRSDVLITMQHINTLIISHGDSDHEGGAQALINTVFVSFPPALEQHDESTRQSVRHNLPCRKIR